MYCYVHILLYIYIVEWEIVIDIILMQRYTVSWYLLDMYTQHVRYTVTISNVFSNKGFFHYAENCVSNYKNTCTIANRLYDIQQGKSHKQYRT